MASNRYRIELVWLTGNKHIGQWLDYKEAKSDFDQAMNNLAVKSVRLIREYATRHVCFVGFPDQQKIREVTE